MNYPNIYKFVLASFSGGLTVLGTSFAFLVATDINQAIVKTSGDSILSVNLSNIFTQWQAIALLLVMSACAYLSSIFFRTLDKHIITNINIEK